MADSSGDTSPALDRLYELFTGDNEETRVCKDIPDSACRYQPRNFFAYLSANLFAKVADELASARLTLPWLISALGAPAALAGFLVPIREAGVLLPQIIVAAYIRQMAIRKTVWLIGAALSALALGFMALTAASMSGASAGWAILLLLVLYSLARGLCSVSAKDVLGKTIAKTRRGVLMGYSVALSSIAVLLLGIYLQQQGGAIDSLDLFFVLLLAGVACWVAGLISFYLILEQPGATEGGANAIETVLSSLKLLREDDQLRRFIVLRALLLSSALISPFFVMLAQQTTNTGLAGLGWLIIAYSLAGAVSSVVLGKLSDKSSRWVMMSGSLAVAITGAFTWLLTLTNSGWLASPLVHAVLYFCVAIAYSAVRLARKVYLVDMATQETRSTYVAVSNTLIGVFMLFAGGVGIIADWLSVGYAILLLALVAAAAAWYAWRMPEV